MKQLGLWGIPKMVDVRHLTMAELEAGLDDIQFQAGPPYWVAVGRRTA